MRSAPGTATVKTGPAGQRHARVRVPSPASCATRQSANTDQCAPQRCENGACQHVSRTAAKRAAVSAHFHAQRANFLLAGGIKQAKQDRQYGSNEIHEILVAVFSLAKPAEIDPHRCLSCNRKFKEI